MSVAFPLGIGLALVIGVIVNYLDHPVGKVLFIIGGVALIAILNANAYRKTSASSTGVSNKGLILSILAGVLMGFFYKYVAGSMCPDSIFLKPLN